MQRRGARRASPLVGRRGDGDAAQALQRAAGGGDGGHAGGEGARAQMADEGGSEGGGGGGGGGGGQRLGREQADEEEGEAVSEWRLRVTSQQLLAHPSRTGEERGTAAGELLRRRTRKGGGDGGERGSGANHRAVPVRGAAVGHSLEQAAAQRVAPRARPDLRGGRRGRDQPRLRAGEVDLRRKATASRSSTAACCATAAGLKAHDAHSGSSCA